MGILIENNIRLDEYRENLKNKKFKRNLFKTLQILINQNAEFIAKYAIG